MAKIRQPPRRGGRSDRPPTGGRSSQWILGAC